MSSSSQESNFSRNRDRDNYEYDSRDYRDYRNRYGSRSRYDYDRETSRFTRSHQYRKSRNRDWDYRPGDHHQEDENLDDAKNTAGTDRYNSNHQEPLDRSFSDHELSDIKKNGKTSSNQNTPEDRHDTRRNFHSDSNWSDTS